MAETARSVSCSDVSVREDCKEVTARHALDGPIATVGVAARECGLAPLQQAARENVVKQVWFLNGRHRHFLRELPSPVQ